MARLALTSALGLGRFYSLINSIRERYRMDHYYFEYAIQGRTYGIKEFKAPNQELAIQRAEEILEAEKHHEVGFHRPREGGYRQLFLVYALGEGGGLLKPLRSGAWGEGGLPTYRLEFGDRLGGGQKIFEAQTPAEALQKAQTILDKGVEVRGERRMPGKGYITKLYKLVKVWEGTKPNPLELAEVTTIMRARKDVIEIHEMLKPKGEGAEE